MGWMVSHPVSAASVQRHSDELVDFLTGFSHLAKVKVVRTLDPYGGKHEYQPEL